MRCKGLGGRGGALAIHLCIASALACGEGGGEGAQCAGASCGQVMAPTTGAGSGAGAGGAAPAQAGTGGAAPLAGSGAGSGAGQGSAGTIGAAGTTGAAGTAGTAGTAGMVAASGSGGAAGMAGTGAAGQGGGDPMRSSGCGASDWPEGGDFSIDVDGTERTYIVELPSGYDPNQPYKLVFAWHYLGGTASGIARSGYYGLQSMSQGTTIFVAAQGIDNAWPNTGGRDIAFTRAMLDVLRSSYCIDEERIFSTGFSYGGIMSNTVGCQLGDVFRAIAPIAGSGPRTFGGASCTGQVAAWIAHGNADNVVSFSSGQNSRDHWVMANGCSMETTPMGDCVAYQGCDDGYPVHWCEFSGGHTQPRFAPAAIWAFFSQF